MTDIDPANFRQLLGRFATGVTVVTVSGPQGRPLGMTASSLTSVSLEPPLVLVCIDRRARFHDPIIQAPEFVINILESHQEIISRRFADPHLDRFDGVGYHTNQHGRILLDGTLANIECARYDTKPAGDHTIVIGRVVGGSTADGEPLLYYRGGYAALC